MQHKSIFTQTGSTTYITLMTMQSQGGTTNETKCNYCPPLIWKQNKPPLHCHLGLQHWGENKPSSHHHSVLQLDCSLFRSAFGLFIRIPISWWLSHHSLPDIYELLKKTGNNRRWRVIDILKVSHKLSTQFAELLSQKRSKPNKINVPQPLSTPRQPVSLENNVFCFLKFLKSAENWKKTSALSLSLSLTHSHRLSPVYILLVQGDFHTFPGL